ncbi:MAG: hypothetical protein ACREMF_10475 [Gemmatimonadales bacterium]
MTISRSLLLGLAVLGIGCGGRSLTVAVTAATPTPVPDVFSCVRASLQPIGYRQSSLDVDAHRVTARRNDETARRADVRFRRTVDEIEIEVRADATGQTALEVQSKTFSEYFTERGPTFVQEETSDGARRAGQAVLEACGR